MTLRCRRFRIAASPKRIATFPAGGAICAAHEKGDGLGLAADPQLGPLAGDADELAADKRCSVDRADHREIMNQLMVLVFGSRHEAKVVEALNLTGW